MQSSEVLERVNWRRTKPNDLIRLIPVEGVRVFNTRSHQVEKSLVRLQAPLSPGVADDAQLLTHWSARFIPSPLDPRESKGSNQVTPDGPQRTGCEPLTHKDEVPGSGSAGRDSNPLAPTNFFLFRRSNWAVPL
jgi:hypothetical protein